jgi:hypothetical protein
MNTWHDKVQSEISRLCEESYRIANYKNGKKMYKKHRPYSVPRKAELLIDALNNNDEETAKSIMLWTHDKHL